MYCVSCDDVEYCGFIILHCVGYKGTTSRWQACLVLLGWTVCPLMW